MNVERMVQVARKYQACVDAVEAFGTVLEGLGEVWAETGMSLERYNNIINVREDFRTAGYACWLDMLSIMENDQFVVNDVFAPHMMTANELFGMAPQEAAI